MNPDEHTPSSQPETSPSEVTTQESFSNDEILAVHEDVFKSGQAMLVGETPEEYTKRVQALWDEEHVRIQHERQEKDATTLETISPDVARWLSHPKIEEYAKRFQEGESIEEMLQGQDNVEEKTRAVQLLSGHLVKTGFEPSATLSNINETTQQQGGAASENHEEAELSEEVLEQELKRLKEAVYWKRRQTLGDDLFIVGKGGDPDDESGKRLYESVDGTVGMKFDAHGIDKGNQFENLITLLKNGIDPERTFYTAPFEVRNEDRAALAAAMGTAGGTAYKGGIGVVTAGYGEKLQDAGIKHVFINDVYKDMIPTLQKRFPHVQVHALSEQKAVLEGEAEQFLAKTESASGAHE
jgi:hypothetical protein